MATNVCYCVDIEAEEATVTRNQVQFQQGLSTSDFHRLYGTEEQCRAALVRMRWPDGFACPKCGCREHGYCEPRGLFQCRACRVQTSARAGTIVSGLPLPHIGGSPAVA